MENNNNRNYDQNDRNPQQPSPNYQSQKNHDNNVSENARDAYSTTQHSPQNGRDSNVPDSTSGSEKVNELDLEIGRRMDQDAENTNQDPDAQDNQMPNPDDFDEGDYEDSIDDAELLPNLENEDDEDDR